MARVTEPTSAKRVTPRSVCVLIRSPAIGVCQHFAHELALEQAERRRFAADTELCANVIGRKEDVHADEGFPGKSAKHSNDVGQIAAQRLVVEDVAPPVVFVDDLSKSGLDVRLQGWSAHPRTL